LLPKCWSATSHVLRFKNSPLANLPIEYGSALEFSEEENWDEGER